MVTITIRRARESDVSKITTLLNELGYQTRDKILTVQLGIYCETNSKALVAECHKSNGIVGFISGHAIPLIHQQGYLGRVTCMVVSENSRGSGVGHKLIQELETWFCEKRCLRHEVTSGEHRHVAHLFYEKHGYVPDERRFIKTPDILA